MNDDLYFLPLLAEALQGRDPRRAVAEAIRRIRALGTRAQYQKGLRQFERLLRLAATLREDQAYRHVMAPPAGLERPAGIQFILQRDGMPVETWTAGEGSGARVIAGLTPGAYCLRVDTGRVLWAKRLGAEHLLWTHAFPGLPLQAAADTGPGERRSSLVETALAGAVTLCIHPGLEAGWLSVEWSAP